MSSDLFQTRKGAFKPCSPPRTPNASSRWRALRELGHVSNLRRCGGLFRPLYPQPHRKHPRRFQQRLILFVTSRAGQRDAVHREDDVARLDGSSRLDGSWNLFHAHQMHIIKDKNNNEEAREKGKIEAFPCIKCNLAEGGGCFMNPRRPYSTSTNRNLELELEPNSSSCFYVAEDN